jgi:hypothetical protein
LSRDNYELPGRYCDTGTDFSEPGGVGVAWADRRGAVETRESETTLFYTT